MRILLEAHHPAHVHFWKFVVLELQARGHEVLMIGRDRDVMRRLLEAYDWIRSEIPPRRTGSNRFPVAEMIRRQRVVAGGIRRFKPDVVASLMGSYTQSAKLFGVRNVVFTDSEFQRFNHRIAHPFADEIHTPECLNIDFGRKHRRYRGFHELAYLRRARFDISNSDISGLLDAPKNEYVIMRLCAWDTFHDIGNRGFSTGELRRALDLVKKRFRVFIQPEGGWLPPELETYRLSIPAERFHDVLAHSRFVVTEGFTTASEALVLGVPSVVVNDLTGDILRYQNAEYGLLRHFQRGDSAMPVIAELSEDPPDPAACRETGLRYQDDHIDVVDYVVRRLLREDDI